MEMKPGPFREPKLLMAMECPKCKNGFFQQSDNPDIQLICDRCGYTILYPARKPVGKGKTADYRLIQLPYFVCCFLYALSGKPILVFL